MAQHFSEQLEGFDKLIQVHWTSYPRVFAVGGGVRDNSSVDAAEAAANDNKVKDAHGNLLNHIAAIIELQGLEAVAGPDTQESESIFLELDHQISESLLPHQFRNVVAADLRQAQLAYSAGAFKGCVVMLGAALEGLMLGTLQRPDVLTYVASIPKTPGPMRKLGVGDPRFADKIGNSLSFDDFKVCLHELIPGSDALGIDNIQAFRNAIHPWKTIQEPLLYGAFDRARALHYLASLKKIADAMCQWVP